MQYRSLAFCLLASAALLTACDDDDDVISPGATATVRFVNATPNTDITVNNNGSILPANTALPFGSSSSCLTVNAANPSLTFTDADNDDEITGFVPNFATNGNYTVVAYEDATGNTHYATLNNAFTPTTGEAGLRVFNAASGSGNVVLSGDGTVLDGGSTTSFGTAGDFFSTPAGPMALTFNTGAGTSTIANAGTVTLTAGQNSTAVVGPAASGSTTLRAFVSTGC
jgi:hypothetical protein